MKTTVELPDDLMRAVKLEVSRRQIELDSLISELVRSGLHVSLETEASRPALTRDDADAWLAQLQSIGAEVYRKSDDPRSMVEILLQERR